VFLKLSRRNCPLSPSFRTCVSLRIWLLVNRSLISSGLAVTHSSADGAISIPKHNHRVGTKRYMAPEVSRGNLSWHLQKSGNLFFSSVERCRCLILAWWFYYLKAPSVSCRCALVLTVHAYPSYDLCSSMFALKYYNVLKRLEKRGHDTDWRSLLRRYWTKRWTQTASSASNKPMFIPSALSCGNSPKDARPEVAKGNAAACCYC